MTSERPLTKHLRPDGQPLSLGEYEAVGGYQGLRAALKMEPHQVIKVVLDSTLRDGAAPAFPPEGNGGSCLKRIFMYGVFPHEMVTMIRNRTSGAMCRRFYHRGQMEFRAHGRMCLSPAYLVANADEMEPGTFKDRLLLEGDPHQLHRRHDPQRLCHSGDQRPISSCAGPTAGPPVP